MPANKIKVVTTVAAWPEALRIQKKLLDKFCNESFEFIAIVDTPAKPSDFNLWDSTLRQKAIKIANEVCDKVYLVPELIHNNRKILHSATKEKKARNANTRAADSLQFAWYLEIQDSSYPVMLIDNDMFPIAEFSAAAILKNKSVAAVVNGAHGKRGKSIDWLWSGLMFLNPPRMSNRDLWSFDCGKVNGIHVDVSGQTSIWLDKNKSDISRINHFSSMNWNTENLDFSLPSPVEDFLTQDYRNVNGNFYSELYNNEFLHYRGGSNWKKEDPVLFKSNLDLFEDCMFSLLK